MRQWLADPQKMCIKHISGEHLEAHMFISSMDLGKSLLGYYNHCLLFGPRIVMERHDELAKQLKGHKTPIFGPKLVYPEMPPTEERVEWADSVLYGRCAECRKVRDVSNNR